MPSRHELARQALAAAEAAAKGAAGGSPPGASSAVERQSRWGQSGRARQLSDAQSRSGERPRFSRGDRTTPSGGGRGANTSRTQEFDGSQVDSHEVARQIVLRQLTMAPRSRGQLEEKLRDRGCPDDVARSVLDRMAEVGLVDDEAYAGMLVRSQRAGRGLAKRALRAELRRRRVDDETAASALAQVSDEDERDEARRLIDRKLRTMAGLPAQTQARRLAGMLARKGYSGETAYSAIREAIREAPEHQRD